MSFLVESTVLVLLEVLVAVSVLLVGRHNKTWEYRRVVHMSLGGLLLALVIIHLAMGLEYGTSGAAEVLTYFTVVLIIVESLTSLSGSVLAILFYSRADVSRELLKKIHFVEGIVVIFCILLQGHIAAIKGDTDQELGLIYCATYPAVLFVVGLFEMCCPKPGQSDRTAPLTVPLTSPSTSPRAVYNMPVPSKPMELKVEKTSKPRVEMEVEEEEKAPLGLALNPPEEGPVEEFSSRRPKRRDCEDGHEYGPTNGLNPSGEKFYDCSRCHQNKLCAGGRWKCRVCSAELCFECERPKCAKETKDELDHVLWWSTDLPEKRFCCKTCSNIFSCKEGRFTCRYCDHDLCAICAGASRPLNGEEKKLEQRVDKAGHALKWVKGEGETFKCRHCERSLSTATGRWRCASCNLDICIRCQDPSLRFCDKGRWIDWTHEVVPERNPDMMYRCNCCGARKLSVLGRWGYPDCSYSVCSECKKPVGLPPYKELEECVKKHPLSWSYSFSNYKDGNYTCCKCMKSLECHKGRWNCPKCFYNICYTCRPPTPEIVQELDEIKNGIYYLKRGYFMFFTQAPGPEELYTCQRCTKRMKCEDGRWKCEAPLKFEICMSCRLTGRNSLFVLPQYSQCPEGHSLEWTKPADSADTFSCSVCAKSGLELKAGAYACGKCKYFVCSVCRAASPPNHSAHLLCAAKSHPLEWSYDETYNQHYTCDRCKKTLRCAGGRWACKECKTATCPECKSPVAPIARSPLMTCESGHSLKWSYFAEGYEGFEFKCRKCGKTQKCFDERWVCVQCKYDICGDCRKHPSKYVKCNTGGHTLSWSYSAAEQKEGKYLCAVCGRTGTCTEGRWTCVECSGKYDVCEKCRPAFAPGALEIFTLCPERHLLQFSSNPEGGSYVCGVCGFKGDETMGKWHCKEQKYSICTCCRPIMERLEVREEEKKQEIKEEEKVPAKQEDEPVVEKSRKPGKRDKRPTLANTEFLKLIKNIHLVKESRQVEEAVKHKTIGADGKTTWTQTHFIFVIDCSGSMKGTRWKSVVSGFEFCLSELRKMKEICVSAFTFDDEVYDFVREKTPKDALREMKKMQFGAKGTNYPKAMERVLEHVEKASEKFQTYLNCVLFLSDGQGGFPEEEVKKMNELKAKGKKFLLYTIAIVTEEDDDMKRMVDELNGDHYKVADAKASAAVFLKILGF